MAFFLLQAVLLPSKVEKNSMKFNFVKAQIANGAPKKYHYRNFYLEKFLTERAFTN